MQYVLVKLLKLQLKKQLKLSNTIVETSPKKLPILPSTKKKVENAMIVVKIAETIGGITSTVPSIAALILDLPKSVVMMINIFSDYNSVINQNTNHDNHPK